MSTRLRFDCGSVMKWDDGVRTESGRLLRPDLPAGAAAWAEDNGALHFVCECGCHGVQAVTIKTERNPHGWDWVPNKEGEARSSTEPTLKPSIWSKQSRGGCGWHGWLTAGVIDGKVEAG